MEKFGTDFINHSGKINESNNGCINFDNKKLIGLYFGAKYCKPCEAFS